MKRFINIILFVAVAMVLGFTSSVEATLFDRGDGLIYDDDLNITWLQNANSPSGTMTWGDANAWADGLVFQGYDDWRLPASNTCSGKDCIESEMGHLFYIENVNSSSPGLFSDVKSFMYWSGTEYEEDNAWRFSYKYGTQGVSNEESTRYAWAVRDGDVGATPPAQIPEFPTVAIPAILSLGGYLVIWKRRRE